MARSDDLKCKTDAPHGKKPNDILFGADTPNEAIKFLQPDDAIRLSVFGLPVGETIKVFEVDKSTGSECADTGTGAEFPYDPCCDGVGKEYTKAGTYYIKGAGSFKFVYSGISGTASVKYTIVKNSSVTEKMACPACKCYDTTWTWTGSEVCDGENVMREEVSNCGTKRLVLNRPATWIATGKSKCENNLTVVEEVNNCGTTRWTVTTEICGTSPSEKVISGCSCGEVLYGYLDSEPRPSDADVLVTDCSDNPLYWASSTSGTGKYPVGNCSGGVVFYLWTRSDTAIESNC